MRYGERASKSYQPSEIADRLKRELAHNPDAAKRSHLLHSLARLFADKLDNEQDADACMDAALQSNPTSPDLNWEAWRVAHRRSAEYRLACIDRFLEDDRTPEEEAMLRVWRARILKEHIGDAAGAYAELDKAEARLPNHLGAAWTRLEFCTDLKHPTACIEAFNQVATHIGDSEIRSALLAQIAGIEHQQKGESGPVIAYIESVLDEPELDALVIQEILALTWAIGDLNLHEKALKILTDRPGPEQTEGDPPGEAAAIAWLRIAHARERRGRLGEAVAAITKARELLPGHPFLSYETVRYLEALHRPDEALAAATDSSVSSIIKAGLALVEDMPPSMVVSTLLNGNAGGSAIGQAMMDFAGGSDVQAPDLEADIDTLEKWFLAHPGHPKAREIAIHLAVSGLDTPPIALSVRETRGGEDPTWLDAVATEKEAPWQLALDAVMSTPGADPETNANRFLKWAEVSVDLALKATLLSIAARVFQQSEACYETALDLYKRAELLDPENESHGLQALSLMRKMGQWTELIERLADEAAISDDPSEVRKTLYERAFILESALDNKPQATEAIADLLEKYPSDVVVKWSAIRLAFCQHDWRRVTDYLDQLATCCPEDAARIKLLYGEMLFYKFGILDEAMDYFEQASNETDSAVSWAARLNMCQVLFRQNDLDALFDTLKGLADAGGPDVTLMLLPELFEVQRTLDLGKPPIKAPIKEPIEQPMRVLWQVLSGLNRTEQETYSNALATLATIATPGEMSGACRSAALLLKPGAQSLDDTFLHDADLESLEAVYCVSDRFEVDRDPVFAEQLFEERAQLAAAESGLEWVDWVLGKAEAQEKTNNCNMAYTTIAEALEKAPNHPGLLEAHLRYALLAQDWNASVDAHLKLSAFYVSESEKAHQLVAAASIAMDALDDTDLAETLCKDALEHAPDDDAANDLIIRIFKAKGDDTSIEQLLEARINAKEDTSELADLYEQKADQLLGMDNAQGALNALDHLIAFDPDRLSAYVTKIELLSELGRWSELIEAMRAYMERSEDPVEIRMMTWRIADLFEAEIGDAETALTWLDALVEKGDRHPDTQRRIIAISKKATQWDKAANALARLAQLVSDDQTRIAVKQEQAAMLIEHLADTATANDIVREILTEHPADLGTLEFAATFFEAGAQAQLLDEAKRSVRAQLDAHPTDIKLVVSLRQLALLADESDLASLCDDVILLLTGGKSDPWPGDLVPASDLDVEKQRRFFIHPSEKSTPSRVAQMAAGILGASLVQGDHLPQTTQATLIQSRETDSVARWLDTWAALLGCEAVDVYRIGTDPRGSQPLPNNPPAVAVAEDVRSPLIARHRFFLARNIWRSARGLGAFEEGDTAGPARWVVTVAAAVLGERIELPLPTETDTVSRSRKAMPRRLRRGLTEPCEALLKETRKSLRTWSQAISFSADRFGLLAATRILEVIPCIVEEEAGTRGLQKLDENAGATILEIPRCTELLRFALSEAYLEARRQVGLTIPKAGEAK
ncbi:MAG: hypothetical protein QNJ97_13135 [Myxococcota bacterium]|nr:hypothetical protein [Myxococcota bacterium]